VGVLERENEGLRKDVLEERFLREDRERELEKVTKGEFGVVKEDSRFQKSVDSHLESKDGDGWVKVGES
jgi:hypothetical protein